MSDKLKEIEETVKKHFPSSNVDSPLFKKIVEVCFHAEYYEQDIAELCEALSDFSDEAFQRGIGATRMGHL